MVHINDFPVAVLAQILYKAAATSASRLSEWKTKLPLVAVCRRWTKLAQGLVFYQVYVELATSSFSPILSFAYSNTRPFWTSNAELLISRECLLAARRLTIELADRVTPECLHSIALEILQLDRVDWQHINTLTITGPSTVHQYSECITATEEASDADIARTMKYFGQNMRNIVELDLAYSKSGSRGNYICASFATVYGGQLQVHRVSRNISFGFTNFSRNIRVLATSLDLSTARLLPSICGETLRVLKLYDVPRSFAWHHFRYDIFVRPIIFPQLTTLHLYLQLEDKNQALTEGEIQDKVASGANNCDQLSFPALRYLIIRNCTPDCDLLYADIPFPGLEKVHVSGSFNCIRHCCRLKLTWVRDLSVTIFPTDPGDTADVYRATNHFFSDIRIGRTAYLKIFVDWFTLDPDVMRWINLIKLFLRRVNYTTACKAIGRLSNLTEFRTLHLEFGDMAIDSFTADSPLFISVDPMLAWGEKLATVIICGFDEDGSLAVCIGGIQDLILHAGALKELALPEPSYSLIDRFIGTYGDRYPHLADIQLLE
ncbi:hypothetical protein H4R27_001399 [Coemansia aciculifera]|nr:hypothetical protein H4R27_001399 [Coemansia aciculifera]